MSIDTSFFGHPRALATLFFTEMWERFSYYGIRAILILYMTAPVEYGGLGFDIVVSASIYALFTSLAYMANLLGGWIADNIIGQRKAILWGGFLIAAGNLLLFLPGIGSFYGGLFVIILGTGLLKPNVSAIVAQIYPENDDRKDAGFYIFYTGINLGAFIAPLVCSTLAEKVNWQLGFLAACIGMVFGIIQFRLGYKYLGEAGVKPAAVTSEKDLAGNKKNLYIVIAGFLGLMAVLSLLNAQGILSITPNLIADAFQYIFVITVLAFFGWLFFIAKWDPKERDRLIVISVFFFCSALFWSAFEQAGSSLNLFANDFTDKSVPNWMVDVINPVVGLFTEPVAYGISFPTGWFQSLNALFIIMLAPLFSSFWKKLGSHEPSSPAKFAWALIGVGIGFGVIMVAASYATKDNQVSPMWLVALYFIHTIAELCLSPVGLSKVTSLAPARVVSLMMGVWFLGTSIGNFIAGKMATFYTTMPLPELFGMVLIYTSGIGIILLFFTGKIKKLMWGIK